MYLVNRKRAFQCR